MARRVTDANLYHEHSSRSHALLSLYLEKKTAHTAQAICARSPRTLRPISAHPPPDLRAPSARPPRTLRPISD